MLAVLRMPAVAQELRTGRSTSLYQPEYHMKTMMQSRSAGFSATVAAVAALAFCATFGSQAVRAQDSEILSPPGQDMVLVPAKAVQTLEQRVIFLEETVAALTESWQHIDTHRLCVSDDSGAETCITKSQLDVLLTELAQAKLSQPPATQAASASPPAEPVELTASAQALPSSESTAAAGKDLLPGQDPDYTGSVTSASNGPITGAAVLSYPKVEIYEEPAVRADD